MPKSAIVLDPAAQGTTLTEEKFPLAYRTEFHDFSQRTSAQASWLIALRREGYTRFQETGFPTTHDEDWRFTNTSPITKTRFHLANADDSSVSAEDLKQFGVANFACCLVFVNGRYSPRLSRIPALPKGVKLGGLAEQLAANETYVENHLGKYLNFRRDAFAALNTAFLEDGASIFVPRNTVVEEPIYVLYISISGKAALMDHPRNLIVAEAGSQATIVEDYVSLDSKLTSEEPAFSNTATELVAGDNAVINHVMIVRENRQTNNISTLRIQQERSSNVSSHSILLGGGLVRNNVHPVLGGEGCECLINGLFMGNGSQHLDNYMLVEHASPHCSSRQFYNGILAGQSHGVFHGRIIVHKDAQKTDAKQTNRNLLLSDDALIDTKPQLEIYADDVKCTHGATIGKLEAAALFYARSRGLDEASARHLLLMAFANECLERMNEGAVRDHVEKLIAEGLPNIPQTAEKNSVRQS
ncbi:MAG TPA: Fe-S cluster assembly protein SufD [Candidatus Angelobacter sp.]|nr:Fe-S cluster assembly protein SufD [Candidatus Angelobacter sp.]